MLNKALKILCLSLLVLSLAIPSLAQNTKGDKPVPSNREARFKTPKKAKQKGPRSRNVRKNEERAGQRVTPPPTRAKGGDQPGKPIRPLFYKSKPGSEQKPWKGDVARRRIRATPSTGRARNIHPQPDNTNYSSEDTRRIRRDNKNPTVQRVRRMQRQELSKARAGKPIRPVYHRTKPHERERAWRGDITGRRIRATSTGRAGSAPAVTSRRTQRAGARGPVGIQGGAASRMNLNKPPAGGENKPRFKSRKVVPRSASAPYMARRSPNTWAHFPRPKRKSERAYTTDLAGKKLRTKNFETQRPVVANPTWNYRKRIAVGERAYKGPAAGGYVSRTRPGQRAWKGDIAGFAIRGGKKPKGGGKAGKAVPGSPPGIRAARVATYQGNIKSRQRRLLGNQGETYRGDMRARGRRPIRDHGEGYSGNIKAGRRGFNEQGERYTGNIKAGKRGFNEQGERYTGNIKVGKRGFRDQGEEYTGNIKAGKRGFNEQGERYTGNIKVGKRGFNEQGERYTGNIKVGKRGFRDQGEEYTGNIKAGKRGFNEQGERYTGNIKAGKRGFRDQGEEYTGNIKVAKRGFTNQGEEYRGNIKVARRGFNEQGEEYTGNIKVGRKGFTDQGEEYRGNIKLPRRGFTDQGEEYAGNIKTRRPDKGGGSVSGKLWNNDEKPIAVRTAKNRGEGDFSGNVKLSRNHYSRNPNSADGAMPGVKASASARKADVYARGVRRDWDYIKNPSSADEAQRTREPGRAFGRSENYQGNIKVQRFELFGKKSELHPDAKFVKLNKNNVPEEKDMLTNFKLWWARFFKKSETQPDHLKEKDKSRTPRYDKGESGLWYE